MMIKAKKLALSNVLKKLSGSKPKVAMIQQKTMITVPKTLKTKKSTMGKAFKGFMK